MSAVIRGATIAIDLYYSGAWHDLTCDTTSADWQWGATEPLGPLTEVDGGTLRVSVYDPDHNYDPTNPASPLYTALKVGNPFRVTVGGAPAWTGVLQTWTHSRDSLISDLNGFDPIGQLSVRILPGDYGATYTTTASQVISLLDAVAWPAGKRYFPGGTAGVMRGTGPAYSGPVLDWIHIIRQVELGRFYPRRDGGIGWHTRAGPTPPASSATINCDGVPVSDLWTADGLGRVRNQVVIAGVVYGGAVPADELRTFKGDHVVLQMGGEQDAWAAAILGKLADPKPLTMIGTILPSGAEVAQVLCAEYGARWTVKPTPTTSKLVEVLGERVSLAPNSIEVDAVTEDV